MKIIFDLRRVGLGNNGGSSTLIKSGNTLVDLGHDVTFIDGGKNQHTWTPLKANHIIPKSNANIPSADFIIATGYKSVATTLSAPGRLGHKCHWIRAWEHWQMSDSQIIEKILKASTLKLVNSICLRDKLKKYEIDSYLIRPGYDFDMLYPMNIRQNKKRIVIAGLNREGVHGKRKRTQWLYETAEKVKDKYPNVSFWLFGSEKAPTSRLVDKYIQNPSIEDKNKFYNMVDIWMATTESEGLHLPPAEAMITECPVVTTAAELSGTQDYTIQYKTGIISNNDLKSFIECVNLLIEDKDLRLCLGKSAREKILEMGDRKKNMQKLINLFMGIITK